MPTSQEILDSTRAKYPQYKDVSDVELATGLASKYPEYASSLQDIVGKLPKELTTLPGQPTGSLLTGQLPRKGVSNPFFNLSPAEQQQQLLLEEFAAQNPNKAFASDIGRLALETGGGFVGALPGAPAGPVGSVVTSGLGYAGGKQLADVLDQLLGTPRGQALSQRTPTQGALNVGTDVALGAALEGITRGAAPVIAGTLRGAVNLPGRFLRMGASPEAEAIATQLAARGVQLTPGMATQAPLMKGAESALESLPFSGTKFAKEFSNVENQFATAQEGALSSLGPKQGDIQFGEKLKGMLEAGNKLSSEGVQAAYEGPQSIIGDKVNYKATESAQAASDLLKNERQLPSKLREQVGLLRELAGTEFNSLKNRFTSTTDAVKTKISTILKNEFPEKEIQQNILSPEAFKAKAIEERIAANPFLSGASPEAKASVVAQLESATPESLGYVVKPPTQLSLSDLGEKQFQDMSEEKQQEIIKLLGGPKPSSFNWPSLVRVRARVNDLIDSARAGGRNEEAFVLEKLNSGVRNDLSAFAEKYGAGDAINAADQAYVERQSVFGDPRLSKLLEADPEAFKRLVARGESANVLSKIKNVVGEEGFAPIKRTFAEKIFSTKNPLDEFGEDTLKVVFSPSELSDLKSFLKQAEFLDLQKPSQNVSIAKGVTKRLIGLSPYGVAMVSPMAGVGVAAAATIPPAIVAKLWLSPVGRNYLINGLKVDVGSPSANVINTALRGVIYGGAAVESLKNPSLDQSLQDLVGVTPSAP